MRTTITLSNKLLKDLLHYAHTNKPTKAVIIAIEEWLKFKKILEIKKLQGKFVIDGNLKKLRKKEINKLDNLNA